MLIVFSGGIFWAYFSLKFGLLVAFMGIRSWRCWRETEICRAIETSAAVLRRCSSRSFCVAGLCSTCFCSLCLLEPPSDCFRAEGTDGRDEAIDADESLRGA